ncbi:MAG: HAD family hydrolase [Roseivirga sp.]|nr:HAD family hydrolase [Roseivirga sp.]
MNIKAPAIHDLKHYKCFFFDFDGVVLESGDIKTEAFVELYDGLGISEEVKKHHLENQGISRFGKFKWIAENLLNQTYTEEAGAELGNRFSALVKQKVIAAPFVPGFETLINQLSDAQHYCVVASGTPETELLDIVEKRGLSGYFHEVHGSPKSKESIVIDVLQRKELDRRDCLFFGDASTDHEAAAATNLDFYARLTDELKDYWLAAEYTYGTLDFSQLG